MTEAQFLCIAASFGFGRKEALLMEISTVYEMAEIRAESHRKQEAER